MFRKMMPAIICLLLSACAQQAKPGVTKDNADVPRGRAVKELIEMVRVSQNVSLRASQLCAPDTNRSREVMLVQAARTP